MATDSFSEKRMQAQQLELDPKRTAVIVVDMVNEFFEPGGKMVLEGGKVLYAPVNALLDAAHKANIPVFYTNQWLRPDDSLFKKRIPHCLIDTWARKSSTPCIGLPTTLSFPNAATARSFAPTSISTCASATLQP
jgi:ureidoacrylate peracid hydrolase